MEVLAKPINQKNGKKDKRIWMKETKLLSFTDDMIVYEESLKQSTDNFTQ